MIGRDTKWYIEQAKRLDAVTRDLRNGNPIKHRAKLAKIDKASVIIGTVFAITNALGRTKETEEAQKAATSLIFIYREGVISNFNKIYDTRNSR
jgi:hypothetical protein